MCVLSVKSSVYWGASSVYFGESRKQKAEILKFGPSGCSGGCADGWGGRVEDWNVERGPVKKLVSVPFCTFPYLSVAFRGFPWLSVGDRIATANVSPSLGSFRRRQ
jgi:hypothetical protein